MERLTTRNIAGVAVYKNPFECDRCGDTIWRLPDYGNGSPTEKLADYEDAEEKGLLLRLPCKVGDTVYIILASYFDIGTYNIKYAKADVRDFAHFTSCGFCVIATSKVFGRLTIPFSDFGKTVFLTKTEAEQKLKEMNTDNGITE